jgi:hypothetical protein
VDLLEQRGCPLSPMFSIAPRPLAEIVDYDTMVAAFRARVAELKVAGETLDDVSGLAKGYVQKLVGIHPVKRIGHISFGPLIGALCVKLIMVEDPEAVLRYGRQLTKRYEPAVRWQWMRAGDGEQRKAG